MFDIQPALIWPEIAVLLLALLVIFADMLIAPSRRGLLLALSGAGLALIAGLMLVVGSRTGEAFHGQVVCDAFSHMVKFFVVCVLLTIVLVSRPWSERLRPVLGEHLILVLLSGLGMMSLASANSLIVLFVALELATIPLMVLTALWRRDPVANEAAVKFLIVGSVASAFTVFGIALVWGFSGGAMNLSELHSLVAAGQVNSGMTIGMILLFSGLAFKTAIAPFHVWVPDVYQGAPTPITAFLAGGSKAAGFTALVRVGVALFGGGDAVAFDWPLALAVLAGLTAVLGNMAAMWQSDLKRLLAHASVGHAGFLLLGLAVLGTSAEAFGLDALAFYMVFYAVAVASVFLVMGIVSRSGGSDLLRDYEGLGRRSPGLTLALLIAVLSMGGLPPMAGFVGKIFLVAATWKGGIHWLTFVAGFAMVLSIVYTLIILRTVLIAPSRSDAPKACVAPIEAGALVVLSLLLVVFGMWPQPIMDAVGPAMEALLNGGVVQVAMVP